MPRSIFRAAFDEDENGSTKNDVFEQMIYATLWEACHVSTLIQRLHNCRPLLRKLFHHHCQSAHGNIATVLAQAQETAKYGSSLIGTVELSTHTSTATAQPITPCSSFAVNLSDPCVASDSALFGVMRVLSTEARGVGVAEPILISITYHARLHMNRKWLKRKIVMTTTVILVKKVHTFGCLQRC